MSGKQQQQQKAFLIISLIILFCSGEHIAGGLHESALALSILHPGSPLALHQPHWAVKPQLLGAPIKWMVHPTQFGPINN